MRSFSSIAFLMLGVSLFGAHANAAPRLSPRLRLVVRGQLPASALCDPAATNAVSKQRATVTLRLPGGAARLRSLGVPARALTPTVAVAELDRATLAWLAASDLDDLVIEERRILHPLLDQAGLAINAPAARMETGITGRGAYVGIVDTGIDFRHADLRAADGSTRIDALLDLRTPADNRHPELGTYDGAIWLRDEIDAQFAADNAGMVAAVPVVEQDTNGHGTHVASIASSNGLATGQGFPAGRYVGLAPEARLVVAQAADMTGSFSEAGVLEACGFLIARAKAAMMPLVVNLSLGGSGGAHDGSSNLEMALAELFPRDQAGLALVIAAGNDGTQDFHGSGWALDGETSMSILLPNEGFAGSLSIELWYRGQIDIALESPSGDRTAFVKMGGSLDTNLGDEASVMIDNSDSTTPVGSITSAAITFMTMPSITTITSQTPAVWKLVLRGAAIRYDAWFVDSDFQSTASFVDRNDPDDKLSTPAATLSAISVGAYTDRLVWTNIMGMSMPQMGTLGAPAQFSAPGPTGDGRFAPDVVAPGEFVLAAMSRDATPDQPTSVFGGGSFAWSDDGVHGALRGTSQAAPMVTGTIALLFSAAPSLTSEAVREILRGTAAAVDGTNSGYSPRAGFGLLDVRAALNLLTGVRGGAVSASRSGAGVSRDNLPPNSDESTVVTVSPRDAQGVPIGPGHTVTIDLSAGAALGAVVDRGAGRYDRAFVAHAPRGAVGRATITVDGTSLDAHPEVFFVDSRAEIGHPFVASSGCSFVGGTRAPWLAVAMLSLVAIYLRRSRRRQPR